MATAHPIPTDPRFIDLTGRTFDRLYVESYAGKTGHNSYWNCLCSCGVRKRVSGGNLRYGSVTSCGCKLADAAVATHTTHGGRNTSEYKAWRSMKLRCFVPTDQHYPDYGARGIVACAGIRDSFPAFLAAVGKKPDADSSLDRPDNARGYDCGACSDCAARGVALNLRWADKYQ